MIQADAMQLMDRLSNGVFPGGLIRLTTQGNDEARKADIPQQYVLLVERKKLSDEEIIQVLKHIGELSGEVGFDLVVMGDRVSLRIA